MHTLGMTVDEPRVDVTRPAPGDPGTITHRGVRYRATEPDPEYAQTALAALREACIELRVPVAFVAFVREESLDFVPVTVTADGRVFADMLAGFIAATSHPNIVFIVVDRTPLAELRFRVRHEAAHLQYRQTHPDDTAPDSGPSEDFARRFAGEPDPPATRHHLKGKTT